MRGSQALRAGGQESGKREWNEMKWIKVAVGGRGLVHTHPPK